MPQLGHILDLLSFLDIAGGSEYSSPQIGQTGHILKVACESASRNGCPYFIFDRNAFSVSQCCRLKIDF